MALIPGSRRISAAKALKIVCEVPVQDIVYELIASGTRMLRSVPFRLRFGKSHTPVGCRMQPAAAAAAGSHSWFMVCLQGAHCNLKFCSHLLFGQKVLSQLRKQRLQATQTLGTTYHQGRGSTTISMGLDV